MTYITLPIPQATVTAITVTLLLCVFLPIVLLILWKIKTKAKISSFFIGAATFIVFALILESIFHNIMFKFLPILNTSKVAYCIYGGLAAGLFEETGRFLAMKFVMKKYLDKSNSIMYGIGHGGIESIILVGVSEINNLIMIASVNAGLLPTIMESIPVNLRTTYYEQIKQLWEMPSSTFYAAGVERIGAIMLHIGLSFIVYMAIKDKKPAYYILAVFLHMLLDTAVAFLSGYLGMAALETITIVYAILVLGFAIYKYRKETSVIESVEAA